MILSRIHALGLSAALVLGAPTLAQQQPAPLEAPATAPIPDDPSAPALPVVGTVKLFNKSLETPPNPLRVGGPMLETFVFERGAESIQLFFDRVTLPAGCAIEVTSLTDLDTQRITPDQIVDGRAASAFFNGFAVRVRLVAAAGSPGIKVRIHEISVGTPPAAGPDSVCGRDNRRRSRNQAIARLMIRKGSRWYVCSGWLVSRSNGFATAGHCLSGASYTVAQFRVPSSARNGAMRHPPAGHQYPWRWYTRRYQNSGPGNDWGVFRTYRNPFAAQRSYFRSAAPRRTNVYVNGYGSGRGRANFTLRYDYGPIRNVSGYRVFYALDTTGGTSGGAVYDRYWRVYAVHTHGGCHTRTRANLGTSVSHPRFAAALRTVR